MRTSTLRALVFAIVMPAATLTLAQTRAARTLEIYVIDVEGGNATLFVSPSGESMLMDTGNAGAAAPRDAGRIVAAIRDAGLRQIDLQNDRR
jgi:beta-lactamase superfamily II metal-dependent hydrolase